MKITALGVNSAFATGTYQAAVGVADIESTLDEMAQNGRLSLKTLKQKLQKKASKMYAPRWQSNFVLEFERIGLKPYRLVLDFGSDIRHSLLGAGLTFADIDGYYCSHPHADHIGGVEGIALTHIFNPYFRPGKAEWLKNEETGELEQIAKRLADGRQIPAEYKPDLYGHNSVLQELWSACRAGMETIQGVPHVNLETFFNVIPMQDNIPLKFADGDRIWDIYTVTSVHVNAGYRQMPSYGLMLECSDGTVVYMPTDTQFMSPRQVKLYYDRAQVIYQDCETGPRSDVHPHIDDLKTLAPAIKKKCLLYHFSNEPDVEENEFMGVLKIGDVRHF